MRGKILLLFLRLFPLMRIFREDTSARQSKIKQAFFAFVLAYAYFT